LASVSFLSPFRLFLSAGAQVKNKNRPATAEKEKTMKLEEIKNKTNEAVSYLVAALESGQSDVLTQYLNAMGDLHDVAERVIVESGARCASLTSIQRCLYKDIYIWQRPMLSKVR